MPQTLDIYDDLRKRLSNAQLPPGTRLQAEDLKTHYGCSASTIRETLFRLSTVGLVEFREQRGFRARPFSAERRHELTMFRTLLEGEGTTLSIQNGGVAWEAQLTAAHHKLSHVELQVRKEGDITPFVEVWCEFEWEFHETLLAACGSELMRETHRVIYDQFRQQRVSADFSYGYFPENIDEHKAILDAALDRDSQRCKEAIADHLARNLMS